MQTKELNSIMEFDYVIKVENGTITENLENRRELWAPECLYNEFGDDKHIQPGQGWTLLEGYTGQYSYNGPVMHSSEYIGGRMETDILANDGYYVALVCEVMSDDPDAAENDEPAGWCVAYRPLDLEVKA